MKNLLLALFALVSFAGFSQVSQYNFSQSIGTYTPISGGTSMELLSTVTSPFDSQFFHNGLNGINGTTTSGTHNAFPIGFNFVYDGQSFDGFFIGTDGWIKLGSTTGSLINGAGSSPISTTTVNTNNIIAAFGGDTRGCLAGVGTRTVGSNIFTLTGTSTAVAPYIVPGMRIVSTGIPNNTTILAVNGNEITMSAAATASSTTTAANFVDTDNLSFLTTGAPGSQVLTVQYKNLQRWTAYGDVLNFQIKLYEGSNVIEFVYDLTATPTVTTQSTTQVGLKGALSPNVFNNRLGAANDAWTTSTAGTAASSTLPFRGSASTLGETVVPSGLTFSWAPPTCLTPENVNQTGLTTTSVTINWTTSPSNPVDGYEWELRTEGAPGSGLLGLVSSGTLDLVDVSTLLSGLTPETSYVFYIRSNCGGADFSNWVAQNIFTGYCVASSTNQNSWISSFTSAGAITDINYTASAGNAGGYANLMTNHSIGNFIENGPTAISLTAGGPTCGFAIWVDWNNDLIFDVSEKVFNTTGYVTSTTGSIVIPPGTAVGSYRMRVVVDWNQQNPASACGNITRGEFVDYTFEVLAPPACVFPTDLSVTDIMAQTATLNWTASTSNPTGGYQWEVRTDGTAGSGPTGLTASGSVGTGVVTADATGLSPLVGYDFYVRADCGASGFSDWVAGSFSTPCLPPAVDATTPATRCGLGSVELGATTVGDVLNWYDVPTGGTPLGTGATFTTPEISETSSFYVSAGNVYVGDLELGAGASTSELAGQSFFPGAWGGAKTQYIIRATELINAGLSAGPINSLGFEPTTSGQTYQGFFVNVGQTTDNVSTLTFINTGLTQVFEGSETDNGYTPIANAVNTLNFSTPVMWDGSSNIVVSISWSRVPAASTSTNSSMKVDNVGFDATARRQRDNYTPIDMLNETSASALTQIRPRFILNGNVICASPRTEVVATVTAPPALTLSSNAESICENSATDIVTITSVVGDYDVYTWGPAAGVTGNEISGYAFNPNETTTFVLTAEQTSGSLCAATTQITVTVNPNPSAISVNVSPSSICEGSIVTLNSVGGSLPFEGQIGTGALSNITSTPFKKNWGGVKTEAIYTAADLTAMGMQAGDVILSIGWVSSTTNANVNVFNNFSINVGWITESEITVGFNEGANIEVYPTGIFTINTIAIDTPIDFALPTPITWDGTSNLLVATCFNNGDNGASQPSIGVRSTTVPSNLNRQFTADNNPNVCTNTTSTNSTSRPNLRVEFNSPSEITWPPIANLFMDANATTPYAAGDNAPTVYYSTMNAGTVNVDVLSTTDAGCTAANSVSFEVLANSSSSTTETVCGSYTAPDGAVYTTSGVYTAVIPNTAGCDSTITIDLTIIPNTQVILNPVICQGTSYLSPAGNNYTTSGTYTESIQPTQGCPIEFTINLTVNETSSSETEVEACDSYVWNGTTYTMSGTFTQTGLTNANGCDSTAILILTINNSFELTEEITACDEYTWSNGMSYTESGTYVQELETAAGCDSTLTLVLTINASSTNEVEVTACDEFTWNNMTYTESGDYIQVFQNAAGCDSTVTLMLTINNSSSSMVVVDVCDQFTWDLTGMTYTESGMYTATLQNAAGCDSIITLDLTINNFTVLAINNGNATLTASAGVSFQWVTCPNYTPITGATNQLFTAEENGNYAVIATDANGCVDTSSCVSIVNVGIEDFEANSVAIYPNPTEDFVVIEFSAASATVEILDAQGKLIRTMNIVSGDQVSLKNERSAIYFIRISTENATTVHRIVKQ